jgi:nucleoid DNA-binding protein
MTLTKQKMVAEIGRRTRLRNRDVQVVLETLMEVWIEELANDGRIELENFLVIEVRTIKRDGLPFSETIALEIDETHQFKQVVIHASKHLRNRLRNGV